jgi:4-amino-4-deoxy-L-arabinose transferase-like glycosyltransferase
MSALRERLCPIAAAACALAFLLQVFIGSLGKSLTWDEPTYIAAGYANWVWGDYRLTPDHPPLMQKLQALPLLFLDVAAPQLDDDLFRDEANPRATYGRGFVFASGNDVVRIARWARAPVMLLGFVLIFCVYGWSRQLFGPAAALLPTALAALSPNLIAHAKLATEDLGCAALMFCAVWSLWWSLEKPSSARGVLCGAVTGLALLAKYTALLLVPLYPLLTALAWRHRPDRPQPARWLGHLALLGSVAFVVVGFAYGLRFRPDLYWRGIFRIYPDVNPDYLYYFLGRVSDEPFWYHAIASLVIKAPLSALLLIGLGAVGAAQARPRGASLWFLLLPPLALLAASCFDITNPGVRRVLPAIPFLLVLAGAAPRALPRRGGALLLCLLLAWSALEAARIFPHHLSYLNPAFGGPERGPYVLDESNIDWGQDLPALAAWQRENPSPEPLHLFYFGTALASAYGVHSVAFDASRAEDPPPGTVAISAHYLAGLRKLQASTGADADWLTRYQPVAKAGYSIFIYRFPAAHDADPQGARSRPP